jgi:ABC-type proline/glycine betaine transport system permease subunit
MITWALIASTVIALALVVVQGKWTSRDSWFAVVFASAVMAMVIDHYINHIN